MDLENRVQITLTADSDGLVRALRDARGQLGELTAQAETGAAKTRDLGISLAGLKTRLVSLRSTLAGVGFGWFVKGVYEAGQQSQSLEKSLELLSGSAEDAQGSLEWLRNEADQLGQNFYALAPAFRSFIAAAQGTALQGEAARDIFDALVRASASLGLGAADTERALNAVAQMMSKGTVQAEELRGQLGDVLPGAFNLFASALGVSTGQLNTLLDRGQILSAQALPKLAEQLRDRFPGDVAPSVRATNEFSEAWEDLKVKLAESGFLSVSANALRELADLLSAPDTLSATEELGHSLGVVANALVSVTKPISSLTSILARLPDWMVGAAGMGLIGGLLFGPYGAGIAAVIGGVSSAVHALGEEAAQAADWQRTLGLDRDGLDSLVGYYGQLTAAQERAQDKAEGAGAVFTQTGQLISVTWKGVADEVAGVADDLAIAYLEGLAAAQERSQEILDSAGQASQAFWLSQEELAARESDALARKMAQHRGDYAAEEVAAMEQVYAQEQDLLDTHLEEAGESYSHFLDTVQDQTASTFYQIFSGQLDSFQDFCDELGSYFLSLLSDMAAQAVAQPIVLPIAAQMVGYTTGGGDTSGDLSAGSLGSLVGLGGSISGVLGYYLPGTVTTLSYGSDAASLAAAQAGLPLTSGLSVGTALGYAGLGSLAYSTVGSWVGLPQSEYSGWTAAGGALGGAWLGALGSLGGPVGALVGTLAGGILGGLLGSGDDDLNFRLATAGQTDYQWQESTDWQGNPLYKQGFEDNVYALGPFGYVGFSNAGSWDITAEDFQDFFTQVAELDSAIASALSADQVQTVKDALDGWQSLARSVDQGDDPTQDLVGLLRDRYAAAFTALDDFFSDFFTAETESDLESQLDMATGIVSMSQGLSDVYSRLTQAQEAGYTLEDAYANLSSEYSYVSGLMSTVLSDALVSAVQGLDFSAFQDAFAESLTSQMQEAVIQASLGAMQQQIFNQAFDSLAGLQDLFAGYFSGDLEFSELSDQFGVALESIGDALAGVQPLFEDLAGLLDEFGLTAAESVDYTQDLASGLLIYKQTVGQLPDADDLLQSLGLDASSLPGLSGWLGDLLSSVQDAADPAAAFDGYFQELNALLTEGTLSAEAYNSLLSQGADLYAQASQALEEHNAALDALSQTLSGGQLAYLQALGESPDPSIYLAAMGLDVQASQGMSALAGSLDALLNAADTGGEAMAAFDGYFQELNALLTEGTLSAEAYNSLLSQGADLYAQASQALENYNTSLAEIDSAQASARISYLKLWSDYLAPTDILAASGLEGKDFAGRSDVVNYLGLLGQSVLYPEDYQGIDNYITNLYWTLNNSLNQGALTVDQYNSLLSYGIDLYRSANEAIASLSETSTDLSDSFASLCQGLEEYRQQLLGQVSGEDSYLLYRSRLQDLSDQMTSSDQEEVLSALSMLTATAQDFLASSRDYQTDFSAYDQDLAWVLSLLAAGETVASAYGPGFASGGVISGPESGYYVAEPFHGTELITPFRDFQALAGATREMAGQIRQLRGEMQKAHAHLVRDGKRTRKILEMWSINGLPS